jgi:FAD synthetase
MTKVMAQGTFDILHPGHLHYFNESAEKGEELVVVISRDSRVSDRKNTYFDENERKKMVDALGVVDEALLGAEGDIYSTVRRIDPDIITLGYDQKHDEKKVKEMAQKATGHEVEVVRVGEKEGYSSSKIRCS